MTKRELHEKVTESVISMFQLHPNGFRPHESMAAQFLCAIRHVINGQYDDANKCIEIAEKAGKTFLKVIHEEFPQLDVNDIELGTFTATEDQALEAIEGGRHE